MRKLIMAGLIAATLVPAAASAQYYGGYNDYGYARGHDRYERRDYQRYNWREARRIERERQREWRHHHDREGYGYRGW